MRDNTENAEPPLRITNCHLHTFTHDHVPDRFVARPLALLLRWGFLRRKLLAAVRYFDRGRRTRVARLAQVLEMSYKKSQAEVFETVRGYYPETTRFVILPMDMEPMDAGTVKESIGKQHDDLLALRRTYGRDFVFPFIAVDPRRENVPEIMKKLQEPDDAFCGIKLYPPIGYHPNHALLEPLYAYAAAEGIPIMTHCSPPASVQYRGKLTDAMFRDPVTGEPFIDPKTGEPLERTREKLLSLYTDPDAYEPIFRAHPGVKICLAHFGGAVEWKKYLEHPWHRDRVHEKSWLAKIVDMIKSKEKRYENLYTDISYTLFADDEYVHLLKVLLSDEQVQERVLFGSDFYVVDNAKLEERRISLRIRSVLGEDLFRTIAEENPKTYLARRTKATALPARTAEAPHVGAAD